MQNEEETKKRLLIMAGEIHLAQHEKLEEPQGGFDHGNYCLPCQESKRTIKLDNRDDWTKGRSMKQFFKSHR